MTPYPVGTVVDYHGSFAHGRYVISDHQEPRPGVPDPAVNYPDGVAYVIWPVGVEQRFGNRHLSVVQVRRGSITPAAP
jgi:hypothetical protein